MSCSDLESFVIPAGNLLHELYSKGYPYEEMWDKLDRFVKTNVPMYQHEFKQTSTERLHYITLKSVACRVERLRTERLSVYDHRNHRLGFEDPSAHIRPAAPPPWKGPGPARVYPFNGNFEQPSYWEGRAWGT